MSIIEVRNLTKKFGEFKANDNINLSIEKGEIRAIIGENGAGKSTLMNMLYGIYQPTEGQIYFDGKPVSFKSPKDAIAYGIGMVHQHFKLVPSLTVYENIMLGAEINKKYKMGKITIPGILIDNKLERQKIKELIEHFNFQIDVDDRIRDISVGARQRVEILKMLYRNVNVLILDEPTAVLIPQEVDELMTRLMDLKKMGQTIIIITHKLNEVKMCADNISVMRRGKLVGTVPNDNNVTKEDLAQMMVGRTVLLNTKKSGKPSNMNKVVFSIENLSAKDSGGRRVVNNVSFKIHEGEILGVAGVEGNGQSELMLLLTGLMKNDGGSIKINGKDVTSLWPNDLRKEGLGVIPEDRYRQGLCLDNPVSLNLIAGYHSNPEFCKYGFINFKNVKMYKEKMVKEYDIRFSGNDPKVSVMSGGNAQKIIIAREFSQDPKVLLACQPTRGVDIGATEFVHRSILELRDEGKAILLISSDLSEVKGLSDRIIVMYQGRIVGEFKSDKVTDEEIGLYMSGGAEAQKKPSLIKKTGGNLYECTYQTCSSINLKFCDSYTFCTCCGSDLYFNDREEPS